MSHRVDVPGVRLPPRKRLTRGFRADYGFVGTLDDDIRDRCAHARTARLMESEARLSHEAWNMAPKRTTRSTPPTTTTTTTTPMTNDQFKALINQGISNALAARDADKIQNGKDSHDSGIGVRRQAPSARECTNQDFMK
nr:hypothetical protein [Tanacetum cinerariifolium]